VFKKILVPLDGSELAECTLGYVKDVASGCSVNEAALLTVTESAELTGSLWLTNREYTVTLVEEKDKLREMTHQKVKEYLTRVKEKLYQPGLNVEIVDIERKANQSPAEVILDYAEKNNFDLIIISTHGRSGVSRWAFGSVAERVVNHSRIPVLTITPPSCRL
jgi:nucleotide-binding universal stress UspA family protein